MFELLLKQYIKRAGSEGSIKEKDIDAAFDKYDNIQSKILFFFVSFIMLGLFFNFSLITVVLSFAAFIADFPIKEYPEIKQSYFLMGGVIAGVVSYTSFRIMRWAWKKVRKPIEKELKLEL